MRDRTRPWPCAGRDRLHDVLVAGAAAEIAFELLADRMVGQVVTPAVDDIDRGHDHAGGTEAALQAVMLAKRFLHRMQWTAVDRQPFDRPDPVPVRHHRKRGAGFDRLTVEVHHAGAALGGVATDMGAGEPQILAQELHEKRAGIDIGAHGITVHDHGNFRHYAGSLYPRRRCPAAQSLQLFQGYNMGHGGDEQPCHRMA
jgi:hypothetical protein